MQNTCYVYSNTLSLLQMLITEEYEPDNLLELAGYDPKEEARVSAYFAELKANCEDDDDDEPFGFVDIEKVKKAIRTLATGDLELFSLWILNYSDSEMAKSLCLTHETVTRLKSRISRKLNHYFKVEGISQFGARIVRFNDRYRLNDFIEERLRQATGTDTAFIRLPEMERNVLKYWKMSDHPSVTSSTLALSRNQVERYRTRLFKNLGGVVGAVSMDDFISKVRRQDEFLRKMPTANESAALIEQIDFDEVVKGLQSLSRKEMEVFEGCKQGLSHSDIAQRLSMDTRTVHLHQSNIFRKIGIMYLSLNKPTLLRMIFQTRDIVDQKLREDRNHAIDWESGQRKR